MINPSDAEGPHQTADALRQKIWPCVVQLLIHDYNIGGPGPKPLGSAVLVRIQEEIFLFSAAHVLAGFKCGLLLVAVGDEAVLELPALSVFATGSSEMGNHQLDPIDAAVAHIPKCFARSLIPRAYDLSGIDFSEREEHDWFLILGYPANRTDIDRRKLEVKSMRYPLIVREAKPEAYQLAHCDRRIQSVFEWHGTWKEPTGFHRARNLEGVSGGAVWRFSLSQHPTAEPVLLAIFIELRLIPGGKVFVGTNIRVHYDLVRQHFPNLFSG